MQENNSMMDIFFQDPDEVPLPPEEVRIREFTPTPWAEGDRIRVYLEVDPFQKRPNAEISIRDPSGRIVAEVEIIESVTRKMELNMHMRQPDPSGRYQIQVVLYYQQIPSAEDTSQEATQIEPERLVVDTVEKTFEIPTR
jgi:hypothetical protein